MRNYYVEKFNCSVMECPACGYKYGHSYTNQNAYPYGKDEFLRVKSISEITYKAEDGWIEYTSTLYICPKCGTLGVKVES